MSNGGTQYKSNKEWTDLLEQNNFMLRETPNIYYGEKNPFFAYYASYQKIDESKFVCLEDRSSTKDVDLQQTSISRSIKISDTKNQLYRVLPSNMKRKKYHQRTKKTKNVIHWGQRKLLLSEIEFLTKYYKKFDYQVSENQTGSNYSHNTSIIEKAELPPIYVIYAGAAPGTHILYLSKLFPNVYFELYDPRKFSNKLKNCQRIKTHEQYFTEDIASEWKSEDHKDKTILFISDIRTCDIEIMNSDKIEECIKIDNQSQKDWYYIIKPELSMFKFRLPYNSDGETEYLIGDIYIQAYAPAASTETRLIVNKNAKLKKYSDREFEEQMYYFNNYKRILNYNNALYDIPDNEKCGIKNNYDGSSEVYILEEYNKLMDYANNTKDSVLKIIRMINEISQELSHNRNLYSK